MKTISASEVSLPEIEPQAPDQSSLLVLTPLQEESANGHTLIHAGERPSLEHAMDSLQCMMAGRKQSSTGVQAYAHRNVMRLILVRAEHRFISRW